MTFLGEIVAGGLAIVAAIVRTFVTVEVATPGVNACDITTYNATLTDCGTALVDQLTQLVYSGVVMLNGLLGGLGAVSGT